MDSLSYYNRVAPRSYIGWDDVIFGDPLLLPLIYKIAQKLVLETLVHDWTHNGFPVRLDEFEVESKLSDYQTLVGQLDSEISRDLENFKPSQQLAVRGRSIGQSALNPLVQRTVFLRTIRR